MNSWNYLLDLLNVCASILDAVLGLRCALAVIVHK